MSRIVLVECDGQFCLNHIELADDEPTEIDSALKDFSWSVYHGEDFCQDCAAEIEHERFATP